MKKRQTKLQLHRETIQQLDVRVLPGARGGDEWTGCLSDCTGCPGDDTYTQPAMVERAILR
ncbi:MAG TPA: hypothetical protein VHN15_08145 [Thermoanaerobaculia bacterium]|nr:hypothetical protein [Thermoanaerobaculia bacterium]